MKVKLSDINVDEKLTPRDGVDKSTVEAYAASFSKLPPVDVYWIEKRDGWWLVDGFHRYEAAKKNGVDTLECIEHQGSFDDALEFAYDANLKHGKPLTTSERKKVAELKLKKYTERNNSWIAEDVGLSPTTVKSLRESMEDMSQIETCQEFIRKDGTTYPREIERKEPEEEKWEPTIKLYQYDMTKLLDTDTLGKFDLVLTDPPYGVTDYEWDVLDTKRWLEVIIPHLADKYNIFWFCAPKFAADTEMIFRELNLPIMSRIVWHRRNMAKGSKAKNKFIDTWEMCFHAGNKQLNFDDNWSDAWFDVQTHAAPQTNFGDRKYHPTQKPYQLIRNLVQYGSNPKERVLDPFAGSGVTGLACKEMGRDCTLIEIEDEYIGVIQTRLDVVEEGKK